MSFLYRCLCILALTFVTIACGDDKTSDDGKKSKAEDIAAKVIYGDDNRLDVYQVQNRSHLNAALSTVALIDIKDINIVGSSARIATRPFATSMRTPLCADEAFRDQHIAPFCTGFLVAPNIVVTAGHCVRLPTEWSNDCADTKFVFGYHLNAATDLPTSVPVSEVYNCKRVIRSEAQNSGPDYSVVELDRAVPNHTPLRLRRQGTPRAGENLYVIGYPSGLPLKIAEGGITRRVLASYLVASLDTYGGNSGSPVFNSSTNEVEGILVRGETDFVMRGNCLASKRCDQNACRGEDATLISNVLPYVPEFENTPPAPAPNDPVEYSSNVKQAIPDDNSFGLTSSVSAAQIPAGRKVKVRVDISHTWRGDLVVTLVSPDGQQVVLSNRQGRSADHIVGTYGDDLMAEGLTSLSTVSITGKWFLKVVDNSRFDVGDLNSWSLIFE